MVSRPADAVPRRSRPTHDRARVSPCSRPRPTGDRQSQDLLASVSSWRSSAAVISTVLYGFQVDMTK
jgi:hypothetical protein